MVYLIDTKNGNSQIVMKNPATEFYSDDWRETVENDLVWFGDAEYQNKIVVMTYAKFGVLAAKYPRFGYDFEIIVCDEIHSLPKFRYFKSKNGDINYHAIAQRRLEEIISTSHVLVVGLSATPQRAEEKMDCPIRSITVDEDVRQLETRQIIHYTNKIALLDQLSPQQKGIVYIGRITGMIEYQKAATAKGFRAICVWSINNADHPMSAEQEAARDYILTREELPPQYDMVILNASSETGINIHGKVDYIVVHNQQEETRTQIRGRYRHDLDCLYLWDNKTFQVPEEFLDCELSAERREQLCQIISIYDDKGRLCKWTTIRKRITAAGYSVIEKRINSKRYYIITL
jgi:hypothetical protein